MLNVQIYDYRTKRSDLTIHQAESNLMSIANDLTIHQAESNLMSIANDLTIRHLAVSNYNQMINQVQSRRP